MKTSLTTCLSITIIGILSNPAFGMEFNPNSNQLNSLTGIISRNNQSLSIKDDRYILILDNNPSINLLSDIDNSLLETGNNVENPAIITTETTSEAIIDGYAKIDLVQF